MQEEDTGRPSQHRPPMPRSPSLLQNVIRSYLEAKTQIIHKSRRERARLEKEEKKKDRKKLLFRGVNKFNWHN